MIIGGIILFYSSFSSFTDFSFFLGGYYISMFGGILLIVLGVVLLFVGGISMVIFGDSGISSSSYSPSNVPSTNPYRAKTTEKKKNIKKNNLCEYCNSEISGDDKFCTGCGSETK
ncbi:MAG: hypothetical protein KGD63_14535 [Candidatus Lokiarchaeota archaeon]|nr:hypothetical protein [Candidatus Lokiarchaeota archaeon]